MQFSGERTFFFCFFFFFFFAKTKSSCYEKKKKIRKDRSVKAKHKPISWWPPMISPFTNINEIIISPKKYSNNLYCEEKFILNV